jgi:hypothetical protein
VGLIDRFTRDEVSAKVWWPVALFFVVLVVASFRLENMAKDDRRTEASAWAGDAIANVVEPSLPVTAIERPLDDDVSEQLTADLAPILARGSVSAVRVWTADGALAYSTSSGEPIGSQVALNDGALRAAQGDPGTPVTLIGLRTPAGEPTEPLLQTYRTVGEGSSAVAEVQMTEPVLLADLSSSWLRVRLLFAVAGLLTLGLALLSTREPVAPIGAGVRFYPESLPASLVAMDREEATLLQESGGRGPRRSDAGDRRIEELEAAKLSLEGELQRALSALAALRSAKGVTPRVMPVPAGTPSAEEPGIVRVPEPGSATGADREIAPAPMEPVVVPELEPEPEPAALQPEPEVIVIPEAEPEPEPPEPEPEPVVASDRDLLDLDEVLEVPDTPEPLLDLIVLPEPEPEPTSERPPAASTDEAGGDREAVDVLNRLVTPVDSDRPASDPGDIRARLARTAALKKPGSRERREEAERRSREQDGGSS